MTNELKTKLRGYADEVLKYVRSELTHDGAIDPAAWYPVADKLTRIDLGPFKEMVNSQRGKDRLFRALGKIATACDLDCVVFVSEAWLGESTAKAAALGMAEFERRMNKAKAGFTDLLEDGLITRSEVIMVTVLMATDTLLVRQPFERDHKLKSIRFGECVTVGEEDEWSQQLSGRLDAMRPGKVAQ